jgi:hypothetical protein
VHPATQVGDDSSDYHENENPCKSSDQHIHRGRIQDKDSPEIESGEQEREWYALFWIVIRSENDWDVQEMGEYVGDAVDKPIYIEKKCDCRTRPYESRDQKRPFVYLIKIYKIHDVRAPFFIPYRIVTRFLLMVSAIVRFPGKKAPNNQRISLQDILQVPVPGMKDRTAFVTEYKRVITAH